MDHPVRHATFEVESVSNSPTPPEAATDDDVTPAGSTSHTPPDQNSSGDFSAWPPIRQLGPDGRYLLEEQIASGGAATVWRAFDEQLQRSVAIKILHPHLVGDDDTVKRFERESRNAARLHHPNATAIYDSGRVNDVVFLVMEYVDGPTLKDLIQERGAFDDWRTVAAIGEQIALALVEAHEESLIHRDIKPANILFTREGILKVADFGIAKALSTSTQELTAEGMTVGTATYIAPEQYTGSEVDERADIYALGMVLYECLTGRPAYAGDTPTATAAARLTREILPPRQIRADVDRTLEDVIVRCTRRDPDERFGTVAAVAYALRSINEDRDPQELTRELLDAEPPLIPTLPEFPEVDPNAVTDPGMAAGDRRSRVRIGLAFVAGMALAGFAFVMARGDGDDAAARLAEAPNNVLEVAEIVDYDPLGGDGEHPGELPFAIDRDVQTAWRTERYRAPNGVPFGGNKSGVGLYVDLGEANVSSVLLDFTAPGASVDLYRADEVPDEVDGLVGWGVPVQRFTDLDARAELVLDEPLAGRYWLVWLTRLPQIEPGIQQAGIAEIAFIGASDTPPAASEAATEPDPAAEGGTP